MAHRQTQHSVGVGAKWETPPPPPTTPQRITTYICYFLPGYIGAAGFPSRGVSGEVGDAYEATRAFPAPACVGHRDHSGGGKPPTPTVSPLGYVGAMDSLNLKCTPPQHCPMCQGGGAEAGQDGCGGDASKHVTVFPGIWPPTYLGVIAKPRKKWDSLSRILVQEGSNTRVLGNFFKAVVQAILLFGL